MLLRSKRVGGALRSRYFIGYNPSFSTVASATVLTAKFRIVKAQRRDGTI